MPAIQNVRVHDRETVVTTNTTVAMSIEHCCVCGVLFGLADAWRDRIKSRGESFYCPNGHSLGWSESDADRERKKREQLERRLAAERDTADRYRDNWERERRSAIAYKGHLTRVRRRIANGVCPVPGCKRSGFAQVLRHIASQHPDWLHDHPEISDGGEA